MPENNQDKVLLDQYIDSIRDKKERKRIKHIARLSRLNIGLLVFLSLFIPISGYFYTRRWDAFLNFFCCLIIIGAVVGTIYRNVTGTSISYNMGSIMTTIIPPIDNALAIHRAKKKIEKLSK
ncbi:MAG: hypothetical protein QNJ51_25340 [Calothrix sp. MO_167.B12]|nr:hypothetical protein [Calothrix sp. MO_167.B12]